SAYAMRAVPDPAPAVHAHMPNASGVGVRALCDPATPVHTCVPVRSHPLPDPGPRLPFDAGLPDHERRGLPPLHARGLPIGSGLPINRVRSRLRPIIAAKSAR